MMIPTGGLLLDSEIIVPSIKFSLEISYVLPDDL